VDLDIAEAKPPPRTFWLAAWPLMALTTILDSAIVLALVFGQNGTALSYVVGLSVAIGSVPFVAWFLQHTYRDGVEHFRIHLLWDEFVSLLAESDVEQIHFGEGIYICSPRLLGGNSEQIKIELCSSHVIVRTKGQESHQIAALIRSGLGGDKLDPWLKMLSQ